MRWYLRNCDAVSDKYIVYIMSHISLIVYRRWRYILTCHQLNKKKSVEEYYTTNFLGWSASLSLQLSRLFFLHSRLYYLLSSDDVLMMLKFLFSVSQVTGSRWIPLCERTSHHSSPWWYISIRSIQIAKLLNCYM